MGYWNTQWVIGIPNGLLEYPMGYCKTKWVVGKFTTVKCRHERNIRKPRTNCNPINRTVCRP